jgi:SSS family transporter
VQGGRFRNREPRYPVGALIRCAFLLLLLIPSSLCAAEPVVWTEASPLPEPLGVAGPFVGVMDGSLYVAGGAHFETSPFQGGAKRWVDNVWALDAPGGAWREAGKLPRPLGYGVSVSTPDGMIWAGGSDAQQHYRDVWRVRSSNGGVELEELPPLPEACANMAGAILNGVLYVAGGQAAPDSKTALHNFWSLELANVAQGWRELEPWPGPARIHPVVASQDGAAYIFSGAELLADANGAATRRFLTDGYRYRSGEGWQSVAGPPQPLVAAPAIAWGQAHILVFGGDDGSRFFQNAELGDAHPGFPRTVWAYHTITDAWANLGDAPFGHVTTTAVEWRGSIAVPSGEDRPGHRSPRVWLGSPTAAEARFSALDYGVLAVYLASLVWIGFYVSRREATTDDFFLAGRRIPWWAAGLSIYGTQLSSISFVAIPAKVYATDWVYLLIQLSIVLIAIPVVFLYLPFFRQTNLTTAYEYLERRFNLGVRWFASASFILFQIGRMSIVLFLPAIALSTVTGMDVYVSIGLMGVLATLYTVMGGIEAVIWTDVVQVFVLLGGAFLSLAVILLNVDGGFSGLLAQGAAAGKFHVFNWTWDYTTTAVWVVLVGNLFNNLVPYTSDQAVVQRYLTTKDERSAARGIWMNALLIIPSTLMLFLLGTGLWAFYRARPELLSPSLPTDSIFPLFLSQQLPAGLAGLVIAGVFAASMSTLDSSLNSVATALVTDFYGRLRPKADDRSKLRLAKGLTALLGAVATLAAVGLASLDIGSLWDAFQGMMGLFGAGLAGLFALGIFTTRANGSGALLGVVVSAGVLAWVQRSTDVHFFLYGMVGIVTCFVVGYGASLVLPAASRALEGLTLYTRGKPNRGNVV